MHNLFRAMTIMVDYDQRESFARENKTYLIRWSCHECNRNGRFYVENFISIHREMDLIDCQCEKIYDSKIGMEKFQL